MITLLEINQYVDSCVNNYKKNYNHNLEDTDDYAFLMFRHSPTFLYFERKYENIVVSKEIASELINMNNHYKIRCERFKSEFNSK